MPGRQLTSDRSYDVLGHRCRPHLERLPVRGASWQLHLLYEGAIVVRTAGDMDEAYDEARAAMTRLLWNR